MGRITLPRAVLCATMPNASHILLADDDAELLSSLSDYFGRYGFAVDTAASLAEMRRLSERQSYDLLIAEPTMPGQHTAGLLREFAIERRIPVIIHSRANGDIDRILGLEMGAEDYLTKPCNARELLARANAALRARRRSASAMRDSTYATQDTAWASFEGWRFDLTTRQLFDPMGGTISLSEGEYQLLRVFVANARQVLSRNQLLDQVYGGASEHYDRAVDVQLCRLRRKLSDGGLRGQTIRTVRNEGYIFVHPVTLGARPA